MYQKKEPSFYDLKKTFDWYYIFLVPKLLFSIIYFTIYIIPYKIKIIKFNKFFLSLKKKSFDRYYIFLVLKLLTFINKYLLFILYEKKLK